MIRLVTAGILLTGSVLVFSGISLGHGGMYRGPGDTVPAGPANPNTPPGPQPPGPTTPSGPQPVGPTTPHGPDPTTPPGNPTPTPPGGMMPYGNPLSGPDLTSWTFWWGFNRDRFLQLKAHIERTDDVITGESDDLLKAMGGKRDSLRPSVKQITNDVLPALRDALAKETNRDVTTGCLIALAKIGHEPQLAMAEFAKRLADPDQEIAETAALAYGILAAPEGVTTLRDLFEDSESGRRLTNKREVPYRTRTFAAYGLGLTGARTNDPDLRGTIQDWLVQYLEKSGRRDGRDLRVAAVISLGLIPDRDKRIVAALDRYFVANRNKEEIICAHVPNAIARLMKDAPAEDRAAMCGKWIDELAGKATRDDIYIRASMAQAIGMITRAGDPFAKKAFAVIRERIENDISRNIQLGYFGIMALGEIAGTDEPGNDIEKYLVEKAMASGGRVMTRAWAALALGVAGFEQLERKKVPTDEVGKRLAAQMLDIKDAHQRSAFAIGLGLMRHTASANALEQCLDSVKDDAFRGYFATGLGLMGEKRFIGKIQAMTKNATRRPELLREAAISLGLLGDKKVVDALVELLGEKGNVLAVQAAVATAVGYVGDFHAVDPLVGMLRDPKKTMTPESRAFAAAALGIACDKESMPWNFKISADLNYTAATETLNDQATQTGILNLL